MSEENYIELINYYVLFLPEKLNQLKSLNRKQDKAKRDFYKLIADQNKYVNEEAEKLKSKYAEKDEKDKPVIENNSYKIIGDNLAKFNQETHELMNEVFKINVFHAEKDILKEIVNIIETSDEITYQGQDGSVMDFVLTIFRGETIKEKEEVK